MTPLLLDSGVWLAARDRDDPFHDEAAELLRRAAGGKLALAALDLTLYETANVATVRWGAPAEAERICELVLALAAERLVRVDRELVAAIAAATKNRRLTAYDGAYVACAELRGWNLTSTDLTDLVDPGLAASPAAALDGA